MNLLKKINSLFFHSNQDLDTIEGISAIQIPQYSQLNGIETPTDNIEYILQRKATEHKRNGRMDLAIACLKKSNEIMPYSNFSWSAKDYLRLVEYLKIAGKFDEARKEEENLRKTLPTVFDASECSNKMFNNILSQCMEFKTDLVECSEHRCTCEYCAKHQGRVYSISGQDKRFPKLPEQVLKIGAFHNGCTHIFYPFYFGLSEMSNGRDAIEYSNRPFIDDRSEEEKELREKKQQENLQFEQDKSDYDLIREKMPELAPKSFGGYRRMKSTKSANYMKLVEKAKEFGINI